MKSAGFKIIIPCLFLLPFVFLSASAFAVSSGDFQQQMDELQARLVKVESQQQELLKQKAAILEQIDQVCIWARHNGGPKKP